MKLTKRFVWCWKSPDVNFNASTDYGETLRNFKKDYMELLTKKTTLIIVGDGRTNYMNPEDAILGQMRERCRQSHLAQSRAGKSLGLRRQRNQILYASLS